MALIANRTEVGIRNTGTSVTVPNNAKAKLMYYLNCVDNVLDIKDQIPNGRKLLNYKSEYYNLTDDEVKLLIDLCRLLTPQKLAACFIEVDSAGPGSSNNFLELSAERSQMLASQSILIAGKSKRILKIMIYERCWRRRNYDDPLDELTRPRVTYVSNSRSRDSDSCILL